MDLSLNRTRVVTLARSIGRIEGNHHKITASNRRATALIRDETEHEGSTFWAKSGSVTLLVNTSICLRIG